MVVGGAVSAERVMLTRDVAGDGRQGDGEGGWALPDDQNSGDPFPVEGIAHDLVDGRREPSGVRQNEEQRGKGDFVLAVQGVRDDHVVRDAREGLVEDFGEGREVPFGEGGRDVQLHVLRDQGLHIELTLERLQIERLEGVIDEARRVPPGLRHFWVALLSQEQERQ